MVYNLLPSNVSTSTAADIFSEVSCASTYAVSQRLCSVSQLTNGRRLPFCQTSVLKAAYYHGVIFKVYFCSKWCFNSSFKVAFSWNKSSNFLYLTVATHPLPLCMKWVHNAWYFTVYNRDTCKQTCITVWNIDFVYIFKYRFLKRQKLIALQCKP